MTPSISDDGSKVAFRSLASNLVPGDSNGRYDIFVKDLTTGMLTLVSAPPGGQSNNQSFSPSISADDSKVAFMSLASNLVTGDSNSRNDVFVKDLTTGTITLVSAPRRPGL